MLSCIQEYWCIYHQLSLNACALATSSKSLYSLSLDSNKIHWHSFLRGMRGGSYGGGLPSFTDVSQLFALESSMSLKLPGVSSWVLSIAISDGWIISRVDCRSCIVNRRSGFVSWLVSDEGGSAQNVHGCVIKIVTMWVVVCHACSLGWIIKVMLIRVTKVITILIAEL